jgi:hypothetical protein
MHFEEEQLKASYTGDAFVTLHIDWLNVPAEVRGARGSSISVGSHNDDI